MIAPPRSATARAASSTTLGVWPAIAAHAAPIRADPRVRCRPLRLRAARGRASTTSLPSATRSAIGIWAACCGSALRLSAVARAASPARVTAVELAAEAARLAHASASDQGAAAAAAGATGGGRRWRAFTGQAGRPASPRASATTGRWRWWPMCAPTRAPRGIAYERFTGLRAAGAAAAARRQLYRGLDARAERGSARCSSARREFCSGCSSALAGARARSCEVGAPRQPIRCRWCRRTSSAARRVALVGNAAQALHPVAAQGFNLGLRDAAVLAELIAAAERSGRSRRCWRSSARRRAADRRGMIAFTDELVQSVRRPARRPWCAARNLGLLLFDLSPPPSGRCRA